jgi:hypothetical protein
MLLSVVTPVGGIGADVLPAPISATFISKWNAKPPMKWLNARLVLTNSSKSTLWFVLPDELDKPPKLNNPILVPAGFPRKCMSPRGFNTGAYYRPLAGSKGKTIELMVFSVTGDQGFRLFRLPPGGRVEFENYRFEMWSEYVRSFKVWTAEEITVNGKEPLEKWLPYETLSDAQTFVPAEAQFDNLDWDSKKRGERDDYPKEPISKLDLKITGSWEVPIENFE